MQSEACGGSGTRWGAWWRPLLLYSEGVPVSCMLYSEGVPPGVCVVRSRTTTRACWWDSDHYQLITAQLFSGWTYSILVDIVSCIDICNARLDATHADSERTAESGSTFALIRQQTRVCGSRLRSDCWPAGGRQRGASLLQLNILLIQNP